MKELFVKWWSKGNKVIQLNYFRKAWKENNVPPTLEYKTNGAKKSNGDSCLDVSITIGYLVINYVNFNLQGKKY